MTDPAVILLAPNVSAQKGGEAMKALQIFEELSAVLPGTIQVTHARNRDELLQHRLRDSIVFVEDDAPARAMWHSKLLRNAVDAWFSFLGVRAAERLAAERDAQ